MIVVDVEVYRYDWIVCWIDCETKKSHYIVNDKFKLEKFYEYYTNRIWITYNGRNYDYWIIKAILCDFSAYDMSDWIINKDRKGFEYSKLLNKFPIIGYDCSVGFRSLKELMAFQGHSIIETSVPFDIDRPLTVKEIRETINYCQNDCMETLHIFVETKHEFESHIGLIKEFELDIINVNKTKAQLSAIILGAKKRNRNDEFDISFPDTLNLGQYDWIKTHYIEWSKNSKNYDEIELKTVINGVPHVLSVGGLHGSIDNYYGEGLFIMADVESFYPAIMIEYNLLSRNVSDPKKYKQIRDERVVMKANKDPRQQPRKIILNSSFGASKDKYNNLYDPLKANEICIAGQLLLVDLLDKLDGKCELIQSNTDGILVKLFYAKDKDYIISICNEWCKRTRMKMEYDEYTKVIQSNVNNYIIVDSKGKIKRKGAIVKKLSLLDNDLPIVNRAVVDYFTKSIPVETTVMGSDKLIDFQKITKISSKYEYGSHNGKILHEKVHRCFASKDETDGALYKKHKNKTTLDKTPSTPINCFIDNSDITEKTIPIKLDRSWYCDVANRRIEEFLNVKTN